LYEETEHELQGSEMAILKNETRVLKVTDFKKIRLPSDSNVKVEGVDVEFVY
jgi:hypothetical protein